MCLIAFALDAHDEFPLLVAANRDEYYARATAPAAWWSDRPGVYGGRDLVAGGSWLAIDRRGRVAAVTNVRELTPSAAPRSRGELVGDFVGGDAPIERYAASVFERSSEYAGFNLLLFDLAAKTPAYFVSNRDGRGVVAIERGVHGLSNGGLDAGWPKVRRLSSRLAHALHERRAPLEATLLRALADRSQPSDEELPDTGVGIERERLLAPALIAAPQLQYGTRASTVLAVRRDGRVRMIERSWAPAGEAPRPAGDRRVHFRLDRPAGAGLSAERRCAAS